MHSDSEGPLLVAPRDVCSNWAQSPKAPPAHPNGGGKPKRRPPPACDYCQAPAELVTGAVIYPTWPKLSDRKFWRCEPCKAWVGCHGSGTAPLGRLANSELRLAKQAAHAAFDKLWQAKWRQDHCAKHVARGAGYAWLAEQLGIEPAQCHIGMFDVDLCRRVVEVCKPWHGKKRPKPRTDLFDGVNP